jgi:molybdenum cofactor cytidylyltransferase
MAELVVQAAVDPVVIVLGAHAKKIEPVLHGLRVHLAVNPGWSQGLASSLRTGIEAARERQPRLDALIVTLADQPTLPARHLDKLIRTFRAGGCSMVASQTATVTVPPALFAAQWFPALCALQGDQGARALFTRHPDELATVPLETNDDLDTPADYDRFTQSL